MYDNKIIIFCIGGFIMEIKVEGKAKREYKPNLMNLDFEFISTKPTQNETIECGLQSVRKFVDFLIELKVKKNDIQTKNMIVQQNKEYNEVLRKYENAGYKFIQSISVKLDYDLDLIANLVSGTAKFSTPPNYEINFGLKDEDCAKEEILALAYKNAENQAKAIAIASGKQIDECVSVSFDSFQERVFSNTNFGVTRDMVKLSSTIEDIKVTFIPADVVIEKTIHCIFTTKP